MAPSEHLAGTLDCIFFPSKFLKVKSLVDFMTLGWYYIHHKLHSESSILQPLRPIRGTWPMSQKITYLLPRAVCWSIYMYIFIMHLMIKGAPIILSQVFSILEHTKEYLSWKSYYFFFLFAAFLNAKNIYHWNQNQNILPMRRICYRCSGMSHKK